MSRFAECLAFTLVEEGGFTHNPSDPGGATNQGITLATLSEHCHRTCSIRELHNMTAATRDAIYHSAYWLPVFADVLPAGVDLMVFDAGVNIGPETSAMILQEAIGTHPDGDIGPATLAALHKIAPDKLVGLLWFAQMRHYRALRSWPMFGDGWTVRAQRRRMAALAACAVATT